MYKDDIVMAFFISL